MPAQSFLLRTAVPVALALALAGVFVRLGFWQLDRLQERRARVEVIQDRLEASPAPLTALLADTAFARYRHVRLTGRYDFANEIVLAGRTRNGSPGVNRLTPLRLSPDTAILVNRGWVYSPDGASVDSLRWREPDSANVVGYVESFGGGTPESVLRVTTRGTRQVTTVNFQTLQQRVPYRVLPLFVVLEEASELPADRRLRDAAVDTGKPVRLARPAIDEGPHKSYAIQWFAFAALAVTGAVLLVRMEMTRRGNRGLAQPDSAP